MALIEIKNVSDKAVDLPDGYVSLPPGESAFITRYLGELESAAALFALRDAGKIIVISSADPWELEFRGSTTPVLRKSDLPVPVNGVITLSEDTDYVIHGSVSIGTDRVVFGDGSTLSGRFARKDKLVYDGTDTMISSAVDTLIHNLGLTLTGAGKGFDVAAATCEFKRVMWNGPDTATAGDLESSLITFDQTNFLGFGKGVFLSGANNVFAFRHGAFLQGTGGTGTLIDLGTSTYNFFQVIGVQMITVAAGTAISGLAANGNMADDSARGELLSSRINGPGTALAGISQDDAQWVVKNVAGIRDTKHVGSFLMSNNAVATTIATQNVFVKIAGTTTTGQQRRFDDGPSHVDNNLRSTSKGEVTVMVSVTGTMVKLGSVKIFDIQVHKNGNPVGLKIPFQIALLDTPVFLTSAVEVVEGDELDLRIANTEDTDDATVSNLFVIVVAAD